MSKNLLCILIFITTLMVISTFDAERHISHSILGDYMTKAPKELFKVWHSLYNKDYDYNSELGLSKYKVFKANLKEIREHNQKNLGYQSGLNDHSDLTFEEFKAHFIIREIDGVEFQNEMQNEIQQFNAQKKFNLDDYNDDDDEHVYSKRTLNQLEAYATIDHKPLMTPIRNQKSCGSCWAFAVDSMIEGVWWKKNRLVAGAVNEYISTQQLVDCDTSNSACNGGWFTGAINYYKTKKPMRDTAYPYLAYKGTCRFDALKTKNIIVSGYKTASTIDATYNLLKNGPVAVAVGVTSAFSSYGSGIFDGTKCYQTGVNHAVTLIGYGVTTTGQEYWVLRNSWGVYWGESGHMRVSVGVNKECTVSKYAYQAVIS